MKNIYFTMLFLSLISTQLFPMLVRPYINKSFTPLQETELSNIWDFHPVLPSNRNVFIEQHSDQDNSLNTLELDKIEADFQAIKSNIKNSTNLKELKKAEDLIKKFCYFEKTTTELQDLYNQQHSIITTSLKDIWNEFINLYPKEEAQVPSFDLSQEAESTKALWWLLEAQITRNGNLQATAFALLHKLVINFDVNRMTKNGNFPLVYLAKNNNNLRAIKLFIENGAQHIQDAIDGAHESNANKAQIIAYLEQHKK